MVKYSMPEKVPSMQTKSVEQVGGETPQPCCLEGCMHPKTTALYSAPKPPWQGAPADHSLSPYSELPGVLKIRSIYNMAYGHHLKGGCLLTISIVVRVKDSLITQV